MPLGTEVDLNPGHSVLDGDQAPIRKGTQQPPSFRPMFILVKRSTILATAELLFPVLSCTVLFSRSNAQLEPRGR